MAAAATSAGGSGSVARSAGKVGKVGDVVDQRGTKAVVVAKVCPEDLPDVQH